MELAERPMRFVRKQMKENHHAPSYVSTLYEKTGDETTADDEEIIKWTAASMFSAGADTVRLSGLFTHSQKSDKQCLSPWECFLFSSSG